MILNRFSLTEIWNRVKNRIDGEEKKTITNILRLSAKNSHSTKSVDFCSIKYVERLRYEPLNEHNIVLYFDECLYQCLYPDLCTEYNLGEERFLLCNVCGAGFDNSLAFKVHFYTVQCLVITPFVNISTTLGLIAYKVGTKYKNRCE